MAVVHLTKDNFEEEVLKAQGKVLIDFWATWCGPCMMIGPVIEEISNEGHDFKVCKVDVDAEPELAAQFMIRSIPTLVVMKDGKNIATTLGAQPKSALLKFVEEA